MVNGLLAKNGLIVTGSVEVQNAVTASIFSGDGSGLSGVSDFPYTGSAVISGSLEVTSSGTSYLGTSFAVQNDDISTTNPLFHINEKGDVDLGANPYNGRYISSTNPELRIVGGQTRLGFNGGGAVLSGGKRVYLEHHPAYDNGINFGTWNNPYAVFYNQKLGIGNLTPPEKLTVEGNISASGNFITDNNITASGHVSASTYYGDGSNLTGIETDPFPYTGSAVISGSLDTKGGVTITGSNALAGNYALKVANSSGTNIITAENDGTVIVGTDSNYKLTVDGKLSKFGNTFQIDQTGGDRYLRLVNFNIVDSTYDLGITAQGISLNSGNNTLSLGGNTKSVHINKGGYSQTTIPNSNGVEMLFKPQQAGHVPQYSIIRGDDTSFQPTPIYIFGGANSNTTYTSAQTGSVILQYVPSVGARGNVGIGLEDPQTRLHVSGAIRSDILETNGTQRSLYTTQSFQYSGSNLTQITMSFENGGQEITNINYTGSNINNIVISGSDGINKIYTLSYDDDGNVTNIIVS
jgi:hypothetical protein